MELDLTKLKENYQKLYKLHDTFIEEHPEIICGKEPCTHACCKEFRFTDNVFHGVLLEDRPHIYNKKKGCTFCFPDHCSVHDVRPVCCVMFFSVCKEECIIDNGNKKLHDEFCQYIKDKDEGLYNYLMTLTSKSEKEYQELKKMLMGKIVMPKGWKEILRNWFPSLPREEVRHKIEEVGEIKAIVCNQQPRPQGTGLLFL